MLNVCTMAQLVYFEQGAVYTLQPRDVMLYADQGAPICRPGGQGVATAPRHLVYANWYVPLM